MVTVAPEPLVAVTFGPATEALADALGDGVRLAGLAGVEDDQRARILAAADVLFTWDFSRELKPGEGPSLGVRFVQLVSAGADHLPFDQLPPNALVASNVGAYAEPMAEHVMAMALTLLKRLPQSNAQMASGVWKQTLTRRVRGTVCGILGFGGIGQATGRRMAAFGSRLHVVNTSGRTDEPVEFVGTLDDLDRVLTAADVLVVALPLTRRTKGLIGARELSLMKPGAVLVNVARGAVVDEAALFDHLRAQPKFSAGIDTWWDEPFADGKFRVGHPFLELPNVIGSPHNSGMVPGILEDAAAMAAANIRRFLDGDPVTGVVRPEEYVGID